MMRPWPQGKRFAFTVFDDTDGADRYNVRPVYALLADLGMRTTKSVWPLLGERTPRVGGITCADAEYLAWTQSLQQQGFEIGFHGATYHTSFREQIGAALRLFQQMYGHPPHTMANHTGCDDAMYWGSARTSGLARAIYNMLTGFRHHGRYAGHVPHSPYFWGDWCREQIQYVRNFTFADINTLACCPWMPYVDPQRPFVRAWFASADGPDVNRFNHCVREAAQDALIEAGGACIMYTHFACGFVAEGRLHPRFVALMQRLAQAGGWFVPVSELLDYLAGPAGPTLITAAQRRQLEWRWLLSKMISGSS